MALPKPSSRREQAVRLTVQKVRALRDSTRPGDKVMVEHLIQTEQQYGIHVRRVKRPFWVKGIYPHVFTTTDGHCFRWIDLALSNMRG